MRLIFLQGIISLLRYAIISTKLWILVLAIYITCVSTACVQLLILNILCACILASVFALVFNSNLFGVVLTLITVLTLVYLNSFKQYVFNLPLEAFDFNYLLNFKKLKLSILVSNYITDGILWSAILYIVPIILCAMVLYFVSRPTINYRKFRNRLFAVIFRLVNAILPLYCLYWMLSSLTHSGSYLNEFCHHHYDPIMRNIPMVLHQHENQYKPIFEDQADTFWKNGFDRNFGPLATMIVGLVHCDTWSVETTEGPELVRNAVSYNSSNGNLSKEKLPNIVLILHESTFDPNDIVLDDMQGRGQPSNHPFKFVFFDKNKYTKASGFLNIHTFGGGSWISEFESGTGILTELFPNFGTQPFISVINHISNSLPIYLKSLGYKTFGVYPMDKGFANAESGYGLMGIDNYYDIDDFFHVDHVKTKFCDIRDKYVGNIIEKILDDNISTPVFIIASTISNHGPHKGGTVGQINQSKYGKKLTGKLNDYINRLNNTNTDVAELNQKLMQRSKDVMVIHYGDHMPSFEGLAYNLEFNARRGKKEFYKTFYAIQANFETRVVQRYENLDISLLAGLILDLANINYNQFFKANSFMRNMCNGVLNDYQSLNVEHRALFESYKAFSIDQFDFMRKRPWPNAPQ